jgi:hypothetical protein
LWPFEERGGAGHESYDRKLGTGWQMKGGVSW